jgi:glycosyltransferase involved in cell wall biosynthesis
VYNHASALQSSLESLINQTYRPLEIVIVNDGSTDEFEQLLPVLQDFGEKNEFPLVILNQENQGAAAARNRGFKKSSGSFVIFWDADTVAEPDMITKMHQKLLDSPESAYVYSRFKFGWKTMRSAQFNADDLKKTNYIDTTSLLRRDAFPGFDENLKRFQDWDMWLTLLDQGKTGIFIPEVLFTKLTGERDEIKISSWLPSFMYKLPWKNKNMASYELAKKKIFEKHGLAE